MKMLLSIGPLHDPVTWYGINYTGTQVTQWDFQNKGKSGCVTGEVVSEDIFLGTSPHHCPRLTILRFVEGDHERLDI